jgi:hypothetical protein
LLDGPDHKPKAILEDTNQVYLQAILKQFSLIFALRKNSDRDLVEKHSKLCSKVLHIFLALGREQGKLLSTETWEIWLKLLMGMVDSVFRVQPGEEVLGNLLASQILKVHTIVFSILRNPRPYLNYGFSHTHATRLCGKS